MFWRLDKTRALIFSCALALMFKSSFARRSCNTARYGLQRGREVHVQDQQLTGNEPNWRIKVPAVCKRIVGVSVTACDINGAPSVFLSSLNYGLVMRSGRFSSGAYLYVTVFCDHEDDLFETPSSLPPVRYIRPTPKPVRGQWSQNPKPITVDELIVISPPTQWPPDTTDYPPWADEPVRVGINPYTLPFFDSASSPMMFRTEPEKTTVAPTNSSEVSNSTEEDQKPQPGRSRFFVEGLPDSWTSQENENRNVENEASPPPSDKSLWPLSLLRRIAQWWLKKVRSWSSWRRPQRRAWRRRGTPDVIPWQSAFSTHPKYLRRTIHGTRM